MANILSRYGIKEVADVTIYQLNKDGSVGAPVLYLDTLKVSTVEQTAETVEATGGKGNTSLIVWDYGKEINVTLEDALFSPKSMAIMFGDGTVDTSTNAIHKTIPVTWVGQTVTAAAPTVKIGGVDYAVPATGGKYFKADGTVGTETPDTNPAAATDAYYSFDITPTEAMTIDITPETFPGTYYITGETYARSEDNGEDEAFQFVIPKAKVLSENTLTMEAEGDPSVFNMNLRVLRPKAGPMMQLIKYNVAAGD